jgi:2-oxo-3-hexenedioate decarboxylase
VDIMIEFETLASQLECAIAEATPIGQLTSIRPFGLDDAYAIQAAGVAIRERQGDPAVGLKLGFTSKEKAAQMGVDDVIIGVLTKSTDLKGVEEVDLDELLHPRIEPEVAFLLSPHAHELDLSDPGVNLLDHVTHVAAAVEVIDSRYRDFKFSLEDVVADNTSAARFRVGEWKDFESLRTTIDDRSVLLTAGGVTLQTGSTHAILGNPLEALPTVQRLAARFGHALPRSAVVLAGAATAAVPMERGVGYRADVEGIGSVDVRTKK